MRKKRLEQGYLMNDFVFDENVGFTLYFQNESPDKEKNLIGYLHPKDYFQL